MVHFAGHFSRTADGGELANIPGASYKGLLSGDNVKGSLVLCVTHKMREILLQGVGSRNVKVLSKLLRVTDVRSTQVPNVLAFEHANLHGGASMRIEKQKKTS